jgi:ATP synthase protein I
VALKKSGVFVSGPDRRSPLAVGLSLSTTLSTIGLEFALPMLLGLYADEKLGTKPVLLLVGMVLGFALGVFHLVRIARDTSKPK